MGTLTFFKNLPDRLEIFFFRFWDRLLVSSVGERMILALRKRHSTWEPKKLLVVFAKDNSEII
ncbi:hypothetical protein LBK6_07620 [Leptospira borgpetersenii serovar Hardjo]|nr:hypothetical protein LBK6_07620 [Leptospira borgpetersenii serovar Hardjo]AWV70082.1 hypothetical protein B9T54_08355 [Leptospira borgpetersenii serovar Hardjo-bovis]AMX61467.1 hypothetical protein LBK9_07635 [Leptospira borgpetersenii serovar Hardjo]AMX64712.1 hypothetical protein LBK30_07705 [Leptospira borgpetersenii serovar Hardjo]AMX67922.1 hypothetical protein LBHA_07520 [Leptospira borgpetersenii serovar Hardjo]